MTARALHARSEAGATRRRRLQLWLRMFICTGLVEREVRRRLRERFGVTLPQFDLMAALDRAPEGLSMGELSRRLMVSNGNVTGVVERLVRESKVTRTPSPADRRTVRVELTPAGRRAFRVMARAHGDWIDDTLGHLDGDEVESMMALLARIKRHAEGAREPGSDERGRIRSDRTEGISQDRPDS